MLRLGLQLEANPSRLLGRSGLGHKPLLLEDTFLVAACTGSDMSMTLMVASSLPKQAAVCPPRGEDGLGGKDCPRLCPSPAHMVGSQLGFLLALVALVPGPPP